MRALRYLVCTNLKNQLKSLVQKPSRLIYMIILLALLVFTMVGGSKTGNRQEYRSMGELTAIAALLYTATFLMTANAGFSRGGNLFTLPDAMLLFTAPIRSQAVLFYGLLRQMGVSLVVGFFLLFQYVNLHNLYGITVGHMVWLLVFYAVAQFLAQVTAMILYAFSCNHEGRKRLCKFLLFGIYGLSAVYLLAQALPGGQAGLLDRAVSAANGPVLYAAPVGGWLGLAARGVLSGGAGLLAGLGLCAVLLAALIVLLFRMNSDFYEDVLKSAEISYSAISAKKEGTMQEALPTKIKVGKTGLSGWGAGVFFRKHLVEDRRSRKFLLPANGLLFAAITLGFCLFTKNSGLMPTFFMATYLQLFTAMTTGRFNYELTRPYLYLVPEPALKKLLWSLAQTLPAMALDAVVVFLPAGLILGLSPVEILVAVLARISFGVAYLAADVAVERIWGNGASKVLVMLLYIVLALVIMLPGIILGAVAAIAWNAGTAGALLAAAAANLLMSLLVLFLCRDMLEYAELNNQ